MVYACLTARQIAGVFEQILPGRGSLIPLSLFFADLGLKQSRLQTNVPWGSGSNEGQQLERLRALILKKQQLGAHQPCCRYFFEIAAVAQLQLTLACRQRGFYMGL